MNLLIVTGFWPTKSNAITGIFVAQQVSAFARLGCKVTVVLGRFWGRPFAQYISAEELGLDTSRVRLIEISFLRLPEKMSGFFGSLWLNIALSRLTFKRGIVEIVRDFGPFDGCVVHGVRYSGLSLPSWRSSVQGGTAIVLHGVDPYFEKQLNIRRGKKFCQKASEVANAVILVGNPLKPHALSLGISSDKLCVVQNGTELPHPNLVADVQRFSPATRRVISVSNLVALKGIDLNLRALAALASRRPDMSWSYHIIGEGPERERLISLARSLGISERVHFLGRISYEETMRAVADADVFSLPSWSEAFGIVYLEAMARMRPVIGCFGNGAADIITHEVDGLLVPPHDVSALEVALEVLIESPELCKQLGSNGRKKAEEFSWEHNAQRLLSILGIKSES
jgi:glycosyltransferase involved in cell wall biosynthesis